MDAEWCHNFGLEHQRRIRTSVPFITILHSDSCEIIVITVQLFPFGVDPNEESLIFTGTAQPPEIDLIEPVTFFEAQYSSLFVSHAVNLHNFVR